MSLIHKTIVNDWLITTVSARDKFYETRIFKNPGDPPYTEIVLAVDFSQRTFSKVEAFEVHQETVKLATTLNDKTPLVEYVHCCPIPKRNEL